jgi:hypothetical protein
MKRKKKLPTYTFPLSLDTINKYSVTTVFNLLLESAQAVSHICHVRVGLGEVRNQEEAELGAGLRKILAELHAPKKSKAKRARRNTACNKRGNKR